MSSSSEYNDDIDSDNCDNNNSILALAESGDVERVKQLLSCDANAVNAVDTDLYTPLHRASYNNHVPVVTLLIESGADVTAKSCDGWQPIHSAAKWGHVQVVTILLSSGADINAKTNGGNTPLHLAATYAKSSLILEFLLFHHDIDITIVNNAGDTAYDIAKRCGPHYVLWDYL